MSLLKRILSLTFSIKFKKPKQCKLIVFDTDHIDLIENYIVDNKINYSVFDYKKFIIYINIHFIIKFISNLFIYPLSLRSFFRDIYIIYLATQIKFHNPKIILTINDNNILYHKLSEILKDINFLAIQNGTRELYQKNQMHFKVNHDYYFSFGEDDVKKQRSYGWKLSKPHPIGSLKLGIFLEKFNQYNKKFDICFLSDHTDDGISDKWWKDKSKIVDNAIAKFYKINKPNLIIALRSNRDSERKYFENLFGSDVSFSKPLYTQQAQGFESYMAAQESDVTLSFASTLLLESLCIDTKSMCIDSTEDNVCFDFNTPIRYKYNNYEELEIKIFDLINQSQAEHKKNLGRLKIKAMNIDKKNLPHIYIRTIINKLLTQHNIQS